MYTHQCPKILKGANRNMTKKEKEKPNFIQTSCDDADECVGEYIFIIKYHIILTICHHCDTQHLHNL